MEGAGKGSPYLQYNRWPPSVWVVACQSCQTAQVLWAPAPVSFHTRRRVLFLTGARIWTGLILCLTVPFVFSHWVLNLYKSWLLLMCLFPFHLIPNGATRGLTFGLQPVEETNKRLMVNYSKDGKLYMIKGHFLYSCDGQKAESSSNA